MSPGTAQHRGRRSIPVLEVAQVLVVPPTELITLPVLTGATFTGTTSQSASIGGVTYIVEGSNDLGSFDQVVTEVVPARSAGLPALTVEGPAGWTYRTFRLSGAVPARGSKGFLRVRVTNDSP